MPVVPILLIDWLEKATGQRKALRPPHRRSDALRGQIGSLSIQIIKILSSKPPRLSCQIEFTDGDHIARSIGHATQSDAARLETEPRPLHRVIEPVVVMAMKCCANPH